MLNTFIGGVRRPVWMARRGDHRACILARLMRRAFEAGMEVDGTLVYTLLFDTVLKLQAWVSEKCARMEAAGWLRENPIVGENAPETSFEALEVIDSPGKSTDANREAPPLSPSSVWHVYLLRCSDGTLYAGSTNDLAAREQRHNEGRGAKYTAGRRPVRIVYSEQHVSRSAAQAREAELKRWKRTRKEALVAGSCPAT